MPFLKSRSTPRSLSEAPDDTGHRKACRRVYPRFTYSGGMRTAKVLPESEAYVWKVPTGRRREVSGTGCWGALDRETTRGASSNTTKRQPHMLFTSHPLHSSRKIPFQVDWGMQGLTKTMLCPPARLPSHPGGPPAQSGY